MKKAYLLFSIVFTLLSFSMYANTQINIKVYLQAAMIGSADGLMNDQLRVAGNIPLTSPYGDGTIITNATILNITGNHAIVDWVLVELRNQYCNTCESKSALLQRDGTIVDTNGNPLQMNTSFGAYYVTIKHRNHLGIMTATPQSLETTLTLDFTNGSTSTFGNHAQTSYNIPVGALAMWAGDANRDGKISFLGDNNDTKTIETQILNDPNNVFGSTSYSINGYYSTDINLDNTIAAIGALSEYPTIKNNVLNHPANIFGSASFVFSEQLDIPYQPIDEHYSNDHNWIVSKAYDVSGRILQNGIAYFDDLGKGTQTQNWDPITGKIWTNQSFYDSHGRPALKTLNVPILSDNLLYKNNVIRDHTNGVFNGEDFDTPITLENPKTVSTNQNNSVLGWYYSENNTESPYQDITDRPYSRTIFSKLNPGASLRGLGGNKVIKDGQEQWLQSYSFIMPSGIELAQNNAFNSTSYSAEKRRIIKTVSRDVHGAEAVVFTDSDNNTLAVARSGNEDDLERAKFDNTIKITEQGFVDIHIPVGCENFTISNSQNIPLNIYDLITEKIINTINTSQVVLVASGFYRIAFQDIDQTQYDSNTPVTITHQQNYYDYSLHYYDKANRVTRTTQPTSKLMTSNYRYNTLGQLMSTKSPDEGTAKFLYRKDGQIRFSKNTKQAANRELSYTNYDNLGRPVESGVYTGIDLNPDLSIIDPIFIESLEWFDPSINTILEIEDGLNDQHCKEQHFTVYDISDITLERKLIAYNLPVGQYKQTFLAGNVSKTYTQNPLTTITWYSYDIYGRVRFLIQEIPEVGLKTIDYQYDPITGQITKVDYQRHISEERFVHQYTYNIAGTLTEVKTSTDDQSYEIQARYFYNEDGSLKRNEVGGNLQGIDYVYNLNGQLKAINHPSLDANLDPGHDGSNGFAADAFGFHIDYYTGDYRRTNTPTPITTSAQGTEQYNGNIKATRWKTIGQNNQSAYIYEYNKNNWLHNATFGTTTNNTVINKNQHYDYLVNNISYDPNGNILSLQRNGYTNSQGTNAMDNFTYHYKNKTNQLTYVEDTGDNESPERYNDLKDQTLGISYQVAFPPETVTEYQDNYSYNTIGQLVLDKQEKVAYTYNATGLVTKIDRLSDSSSSEYTTIYHQDYNTITDEEVNFWNSETGEITIYRVALGEIGNRNDRTPPGNIDNPTNPNACPVIDELYRHRVNLSFSDHTPYSAIRELRTLSNVHHKLSLDLIVLQQAGLLGGSASVGATINVKRKNSNQILASTTIQSQPNEHCNRYYDRHIELDFVAPENTIELEITGTGSNPITLQVDNILLQVAKTPVVAFEYNDKGHRVRKDSYINDTTISTIYVRDATGQPLAIYDKPDNQSDFDLKEHPIYGTERVGVYYKLDEQTAYELKDHLGNVRAVVSKTNIGDTQTKASSDYYPFGMPMPNRNLKGDYRYAYQGQEVDSETGKEAFELRLWDGRIGRWLTTDPAGQYASPYLGMGNNPINGIDPDGAKFFDWVFDPESNRYYWDDDITSQKNLKGTNLKYIGTTKASIDQHFYKDMGFWDKTILGKRPDRDDNSFIISMQSRLSNAVVSLLKSEREAKFSNANAPEYVPNTNNSWSSEVGFDEPTDIIGWSTMSSRGLTINELRGTSTKISRDVNLSISLEGANINIYTAYFNPANVGDNYEFYLNRSEPVGGARFGYHLELISPQIGKEPKSVLTITMDAENYEIVNQYLHSKKHISNIKN